MSMTRYEMYSNAPELVMSSMKYLFLFIVLFSLLIVAISRADTTDTTGGTTYINANHMDNWVFIQPVIASSSGTLQSIGINCYSCGNGNIEVAIYSDSGGAPNSLMGNSISVTSSSGFTDYAIPQSVTITATNTYWLAVQMAGHNDVFYYNMDGLIRQGQSYGDFPNTFTSSDAQSIRLNMRMTYTSASSTTSTSTSTSTSSTSTSTSSTSTSTSTSTSSTSTSTSTSSTSTSTSSTSTSTSTSTSSTSTSTSTSSSTSSTSTRSTTSTTTSTSSTSTSTSSTSTSTTSTSINPLSPVENTSTQSIGTTAANSLAMPAFPYIFIFVVTGVVAFRTWRGDIASFTGVITSALLYLVYSYWLKTQIAGLIALGGVFALLTLLAVWEMQFRNRKPKEPHETGI